MRTHLCGLFGQLATVLVLVALAACATPVRLNAMPLNEVIVTPQFLPDENTMIAADGARLGLTLWQPETPGKHVIVGIHGMNNYAGEFRLAAPEWAKQGITVYAYDQRGFGRSAGRGYWPNEDLMRDDLRTAVAIARARHPDATLTVVAISMGAAVAITAFASDTPPEADQLILSGPGLLGWRVMNPVYKASLQASARLNPGLIVRTPGFAKPVMTDNTEFLEIQEADPLATKENRVDQLTGVVSLMDHALDRVASLPREIPVLISYGGRDEVIPPAGPKLAASDLPAHVRTVCYPGGYHILLSDLQRGRVIADYAAFIEDPQAVLPSGEGEWPFR
jgi:acylglycerol lipase